MTAPRTVRIEGGVYRVYEGRMLVAEFVPNDAAAVTAADVEWARLYAVPRDEPPAEAAAEEPGAA